jgi:hypothetical protein
LTGKPNWSTRVVLPKKPESGTMAISMKSKVTSMLGSAGLSMLAPA